MNLTPIKSLGRGEPRGDGNRIEAIACEVRRRNQNETMLAIWQGEFEESTNRAGQPTRQEKWIWLPLSQITVNGDGTVSMPRWLARKKGLLG